MKTRVFGRLSVRSAFVLTVASVVATSGAMAGDLETFLIAKAKMFMQNSTGAAFATNGFLFHADLRATTNNVVTEGYLASPLSTNSLELHDRGAELNTPFATDTALDAAYPSGSYAFYANTVHEGTRTIPVTVSSSSYPNSPHINNYSAAQVVNSSAVFRLTWDPIAAGAADRLSISITDANDDEVYGSPDLMDASALRGTATNFDIPAFVLAQGTTYNVQIVYGKVLNSVTNGTVHGASGYGAVLNTTLKTTGSIDTTAPTLAGTTFNNGVLAFTFSEAMATNGWSINWNSTGGITTSGARWTADRRTFSLNVTGPAGTTFTPVLNPGGYQLSFKDVAGNYLAQNTTGPTFKIITASVWPTPYALVNSRLSCLSTPTNLLYQWQRSSTNIPGATASTFVANLPGVYRAIAKTGNSSFMTTAVTVLATNQTKQVYWQGTNGNVAVWFLYGTNFVASVATRNVELGWIMVAQADFNHDGQTDFLWQKTNGTLMSWTMNGTTFVRTNKINYGPLPAGSQVLNSKDFNNDLNSDLLVQNAAGLLSAVYLSAGGTNTTGSASIRYAWPSYRAVAMADFNNDTRNDILWQNTTNRTAASWTMTNATYQGYVTMFGGNATPAGWTLRGAVDLNGDGQKDVLLQNDAGQAAVWLVNRTNRTVIKSVLLRNGSAAGYGWKIVGPK